MKTSTKNSRLKKIALLPNVITAFALSCGLFVIFKMNMTPVGETTVPLLMYTAGLLLLAAFADILDGAVARAMKVESYFGGLFDSLQDAISFGVAPSVIILKSLSIPPGTEMAILLTAAGMVYTVCGVLRLVRFNVMAMNAKIDPQLAKNHQKHFTGLPIPAAAVAAISMNLFLASEEFKPWLNFTEDTRIWILIVALLTLGFLMVSRWKFPSLKSLHIKVASFRLVLATTLIAIGVFYYALSHFALIFLIASWGYVIVAWLLSVVRKIFGKRIQTLEEFEPEPEDAEDIEEGEDSEEEEVR